MVDLFSWTSAQFGLAVGLLIVAVVVLWKLASVKDRALIQRLEQEIGELKVEKKELQIQSDLYRDRWIETLGAAEVGKEVAERLAGGRRRPGGR